MPGSCRHPWTPWFHEPFYCLIVIVCLFVLYCGQANWTCVFVVLTRSLRFVAKDSFKLAAEVPALPIGLSYLSSITRTDNWLKTTQHGVSVWLKCIHSVGEH